MTGRIFDIQRFSVHDGPGIRTTVFMKGCPLRCEWCHNPEGLEFKTEAQFFKDECIGCGSCGGERSIENSKKCPSGALTVSGRDISVNELLTEVLRDRDFYSGGGGVTFSGGECLMQTEFVTEVLKRLYAEGISAVIDTSGYAPWKNIRATLPYTSLYLYDVKCADPKLHKTATGCDNSLILENLKRLDEAGGRIWIRVPVIPGFNDSKEEMKKIAETSCSIKGAERITLMPYHTLGKNKYETLGKKPPYNTDKLISVEKLEDYKEIFRKSGLFVE